MKHLHKWIRTLMDNLDTELDEKTRTKIVESCGRTCISRSFIKKAQACKNDAKNMMNFWMN